MSAGHKETWTTRVGVILAVTGSAVGLGNFLRIPGLAAKYGGGVFMIPYFTALLLLGVPLAWVEWTLGRYGGVRGFNSAAGIFRRVRPGKSAAAFGVLALIVPVMIYMYYVFIEAWCLGYAWYMLTGQLDLGPRKAAYLDFFSRFVGFGSDGAVFSAPGTATLVFLILCFAANIAVVYRGLSRGIEWFCNWAMPALVVCGLLVLLRVLTLGTPDPDQPEWSLLNGLGYMWNPQIHQADEHAQLGLLAALADAQMWMEAAGQIFFSVAIGFGIIINYASYLKRHADVALSGLTAVAGNEFCEVVLGGLITIPAAFVFLGPAEVSQAAESSFNLGFKTLPMIRGRKQAEGGRDSRRTGPPCPEIPVRRPTWLAVRATSWIMTLPNTGPSSIAVRQRERDSRMLPKFALPLVLLVCVVCPKMTSAAEPQPRTWTDATKTFRIKAAFVDVQAGRVRLKRTDGTTIAVPSERLSQADQDWVRQQTAAPAGSGAAPAGQWPTFRGPNRDGRSPDQGLLKAWPEDGPKLLWKATDIGKGYSGVAVVDGTVYITGDVDDLLLLWAYDLDGQLRWKSEAAPACKRDWPGSRATPTIDGQNIYLLSGDGLLGCYDAKSGERRWSKEAKEFGGDCGGWGYSESVLISGPMAIFKPGGNSCIVALDKQSGEPTWKSQGFSAGPEYSSCLAITHHGIPMIITGTREGLFGVKADSGALLWKNGFAAGNVANVPTPAYSDGYVFWANGYGKGGVCVKLDDQGEAAEVYTTPNMECHHGGYIIDNGYVYGNNGGGWTCLDLRTGEKQWSEHGVGKGSLCWADGMLYLFSEQHGQAALATCSPEGLEIKGKVKVEGEGPSWAHPVVIGGRLYLRYDTNLYCFDVKTP